MSGFTLNVAAPRRGGELLFRDGWLLRWEGDQLVPMCRSFPLPTGEMPVPNAAPLLRWKAWNHAVEETQGWCERINKKLDRKPQPRNEAVMLGTFGKGKVRLSYAYPALDEDVEEVFIGNTAEPVEGEFTAAPFGYFLDDVPLTVLNPQPLPPSPSVKNADLYNEFFIDSLLYRSKAETENGQKKACQSMEQMRAARKTQYRKGVELLQNAGFNKHSRSVDGAIDSRTTCPRCGCQVFIPFGKQTRKMERLRCKDCGFQVRSTFYEPTTADEISLTGRTQLAGVANRVKPPRAKARISQTEFVARLRQNGMLQDIQTPQDLDEETKRKLTGSYLQLVHGWTASDVQLTHGFQDEQVETIRKRATRLLGVLLKAGIQPMAGPDSENVPSNPLYTGEGLEEICIN